MRILLLTALFVGTVGAQTLTVPLPAGCTAPTISGTVISCPGGTTPPPVCAPTPPTCPATVPDGCAPCTQPPVEPPVGTLPAQIDGVRVINNGKITSDVNRYELGYLNKMVDARLVEKGKSVSVFGYGGSGNFAGECAITSNPSGPLVWKRVGSPMPIQPGQWILTRRTKPNGYYPDPAALAIYPNAVKKKTTKK